MRVAGVWIRNNGGLWNGPRAHFLFVDSALLNSAAMDGRFLILAIRDDRKGNQVRPWMDAL
jgi:hypothetical protein